MISTLMLLLNHTSHNRPPRRLPSVPRPFSSSHLHTKHKRPPLYSHSPLLRLQPVLCRGSPRRTRPKQICSACWGAWGSTSKHAIAYSEKDPVIRRGEKTRKAWAMSKRSISKASKAAGSHRMAELAEKYGVYLNQVVARSNVGASAHIGRGKKMKR